MTKHAVVIAGGLSTGVQDAVNLGWKPAQVVHRRSPDSLLDTYHAERHPVAARVLRNTMASVVLRRSDDRTNSLRAVLTELLLHRARPVLLNLDEPGTFDITPWADRVQLVDARYAGPWELPALGPVAAAVAVLIRPMAMWRGWETRGSPASLRR